MVLMTAWKPIQYSVNMVLISRHWLRLLTRPWKIHIAKVLEHYIRYCHSMMTLNIKVIHLTNDQFWCCKMMNDKRICYFRWLNYRLSIENNITRDFKPSKIRIPQIISINSKSHSVFLLCFIFSVEPKSESSVSPKISTKSVLKERSS